MNEKIFDLFTKENVESYTKACVDVHDYIKYFINENYKLIIIPSRGAYPFFQWAEYYDIQTTTKQTDRLTFNIKNWLLPFTSDWGDLDLNIDSKRMRLFWTKIIADAFNSDKSIYYKLYENLVNDVGDYLTINTMNLLPGGQSLEKNQKFIFLDTAISGRAICEILEGFKTNNLDNYLIILIAENNGNDLKPEYKTIIYNEISKDKLILLKVTKIFSEDASPLFNGGISSIVFPTLIDHIYSSCAEFSSSNCVGAGIWFIDSMSNLINNNSNLNAIRGTIAFNLHLELQKHIPGRSSSQLGNDIYEINNYQIIDLAKNFNLFDPANTKSLVFDRIHKKNQSIVNQNMVDVSSSHVIRVNFEEKYVNQFIQKLKKY